MSELSTDKSEKCPFCGSVNIEKHTEYHSKGVGWDAGLGSPGTMTFKKVSTQCNSCNIKWEGKV